MRIILLDREGKQYIEFEDDSIGFNCIIEWNKRHFKYHDNCEESWIAFIELPLIHVDSEVGQMEREK